ncbi:myo-inosose-2 dehydratase [Pelagicoccus enzymogenes]|uniref:myo-inosose-2 dehydratase n=1 Tax=Pelagicoccus enzymogenes TaxID=2773457 RepID=UPI00280D0204|nr:myo-inosose-2 dehydratase [Pelagicoccus enzymogenes]MDQ8199750.1 myo-inosose-2 dehydratase [Pelagicoccus enzymogenes]
MNAEQKPRLDPNKVFVGANPIIWSNDDFNELNGDLPLDELLADMRRAGYAGSELGHAYPRSSDALRNALDSHQLRLVSGWHSTFFATQNRTSELDSLDKHCALLASLGAQVAVVAECSHCIHGDRNAALGYGDRDRKTLNAAEWTHLIDGMNAAIGIAARHGLSLVYHHHMGTVIQTGDELDRLLAGVPELDLVLDPGHLAFAGLDPVAVLERHSKRVRHAHLKSVRPEIAEKARAENWSFHRAVCSGVFTIPGDGMVDFPAIFARLAALDYAGWLVVEAEEDPTLVPPLPKAIRAREYVREQTGL